MVLKIPQQYLSRKEICTTILDVINPAHFILKECPGVDSSPEARNFAEAEESMQKYYKSLEPSFFQMPLKDSIVVVVFQSKFYRAKVISILTMTAGHLFKVYLLDYGKECNVPRPCIYEIQKDFLAHPFQAVNFKLLGIEPISLVMSSVDLMLSYGPVTEWDLSSERFINNLKKEMCNAYIEIETHDDQYLYGNLYMNFDDSTVKCINDELILNKFARLNENSFKNGDVNENTVLESITPENTKSFSPKTSPHADAEFQGFKVSFTRPSDGKVLAESTLDNPHQFAPDIPEKRLEFKDTEERAEITSPTEERAEITSPTEERAEITSPTEERAEITSPTEERSKITSPMTSDNAVANSNVQHSAVNKLSSIQKLRQLKQRSPNQTNIQKSPVGVSKDIEQSPPAVASIPNQTIQSAKTQEVSSSETNKLSSLQKLRQLKQKSLNQSNVQNGNVEASQIRVSNDADQSPPAKQSVFNQKIQSPKPHEMHHDSSVKCHTNMHQSNTNTAVVLPSITDLSICSSPESPSRQQDTTPNSSVEPASRNLIMFQKLQRLKGKTLQASENLQVDSVQCEKVEIKSLEHSPVHPESTLTSSPTQSTTSSASLSSPPEAHKVSPKKVKAFFEKRRSLQANATVRTNGDTTAESNSVSPINIFATVPEKSAPLPNISLTEKLNTSKSPIIQPQQCHAQSKNFVCSSPKKTRKIILSPAGSESSVNNAKPITPPVVKLPKVPKTLREALDKSFSDSDSSRTSFINSQILRGMSDMSDSDDILYTLSKKKRDSFSDKSDIDESYIDIYAKLERSESKPSIDFSSLWEKQQVPALQIGTAIPNPALTIEAAEFSPRLRKVLKQINFYGPSCIQSVVWPSMTRSRCLIAIAPPHSGKTIAYVLPLVSVFTDDEAPIPRGTGPIAIILCSSWRKAQAVNDFFHLFLGDTKLNIVTLCADGGNLRNKILSLINGCDVLISTPFCLLQCLKNNLVNFSRCNHFILDDGTTLMTQQKKELKKILLQFVNAVKGKDDHPQLVVCANRWDQNFHVILEKLMSMPLLFFTSFLESAIYAQIQILCHISEETEKKKRLLDAVKDVAKVVICTTNKEDAIDVHHFLRCEDVRTYLVTEEMAHYIADEVIKDWKCARFVAAANCLVITDQALIKMCISSADCLIHYDIPPSSRLQFGNRFSCIAEHFQDKEKSKKCVCHIFLTENDSNYVSDIEQIIENSGGVASKELKEICKKEIKRENSSGPLCKYFKAFSFCRGTRCEYRHSINSEFDKPNVTPCQGDIHGLVTHVIDASHYYVRLLRYLDPETNKTISLGATYAKVGFILKDFYANVTNEMEVATPVVGESYVLVEDDVLFYRIKILKQVIPKSSREFPKWKVLFMDEGWIKYYEKLKIYKLSDEIELPKPLAVEVYVCNIVTPDSCLDWNPRTIFLTSNIINKKEIYGKIVLCLGDTLWLDPIVLRAQLGNRNEYVDLLKVGKRLIECGHAKENMNHLTMLQKACCDKIPLPRIIKHIIKEEQESNQDQSPISYAFLDCDIDENVYVSSVISPHHFYVQRAKFVECLDDLLDRINAEIENKTLKRNFTLCKDMHCIAPFHEDGRYYRAIITGILPDGDVELFYVDFGDSGKAPKSEIYILPPTFLLLPFQAIECELSGIAAAHGGWSESAADTLYNLSRDDCGDMKILQLKAYSKRISYAGGNHYVVDLWYNEKSVSQQLLEAGFGAPIEVPAITSSEEKCNNSILEQYNDDSVDLSGENSSEESEDKDAAALFCCVLSKMMVETNNGTVSTTQCATITEVTSEDEDNANLSSKSSVRPEAVKNFVALNQQDNRVKPLITWWNTPEKLSIFINLKNIKEHHLLVTDEGFSFDTVIGGIHYSTEERLYDKIHSKDKIICPNENGINIVAKKQVYLKWPRLVAERCTLLHIKYDLIHISDSDSDDSCVDVNSNYTKEDAEFYQEKDASSTDEDEAYVPPWKQISEHTDPYNLIR